MSKKNETKKGSFGEIKLKVSKKYLIPDQRGRMVLLGVIAILLLLALAGFNFLQQNASFASKGPLSTKHTSLEKDCQSCHAPFSSVTNENCSECHEKKGDEQGIYTYKTHYLYRSNDFDRLTEAYDEAPCFTCHAEHEGRESNLRSSSDPYCLSCHEFKSFNEGHPEFKFAKNGERSKESPSLKFPHIPHVKKIMDDKKLPDTEIEQSCLFCHNPRPDGKNFQTIKYEQHCPDCHIKPNTQTEFLPIKTKNHLGLETLDSLQQSRAPGTRWTFFANPKEFRTRPRKNPKEILKKTIYHRDPWIMENLRGLRKSLYNNGGLADLLDASPDIPANSSKEIYLEALQTLKNRTEELRSRPERAAQKEIKKIDKQLKRLTQLLNDPYLQLDESRFSSGLQQKDSKLSKNKLRKILELVTVLTEPCQLCHNISKATIERVQKDQRLLRLARFDHRAHIPHIGCLKCHSEIPIEEGISKEILKENPQDQASILNIPTIESCQKCHNPEGASTRCITCHDFHANKTHRSSLVHYLD